MTHQKSSKPSKQISHIMLILFLSFAMIQTISVACAQSTSGNQWKLNLSIENSHNVGTSTFSPFDQVQLYANVTYGNAVQPDILVYFNITGPQDSSNSNIISRIETTNASGNAGFTFRLPIQNENESSLIGTWHVLATIQTTNGTIFEQTASFTTGWNLGITSINLLNVQGQNQSVFSPGDAVRVQLTINNTGQPQTANVTLNMLDSMGNIVNKTQILNSQIDKSSANSTQLQTDFQVPSNATAGKMAIDTGVFSGSYQNISLPVAESRIVYFTIGSNTTITPTPTSTSPSPTATPTSGPTPPPPNVTENSISLFSWLEVATGLFTFTVLFMFLKRKTLPKINTQIPNLPTINHSPAIATPLQSVTQTTNQQSSQTDPTAKIAPSKTINATMATQIPAIFETWQSITPNAESKFPIAQESPQAIATQLSRIAEAGKRVQTLEAALKIEREQLSKEVADLNKILEEQERAIKNYFDSIRQAITNIDPNLNKKQDSAVTHENENQQPYRNENE